jgi:outer membrane autotransporter protein
MTIGSLAGGGTTGGNVTLGTGALTTGDGSSTIYAGTISGTGSLVKTGTGTFTLSGANTYTGTTTIDAGSLSVTGSLASPVIISPAGTLKGNSTINANVINKGTIAPGNSIGTISIAGNYTQNAGSVYQVEVNEEGQSDRLNVGGTATLNGGTVAVMAESGIFRLRTPYTILTAGSIAGTFANVTSNLAFLTPSLSYDATHVYLLLARNTTDFSAVAYTGNQKAVASALDRIALSAGGDMEDVINTLLYLSPSGARGAYDQMGGLTHSALTGVTFSTFNTYIGAIAERTKSFMTGGSSSSFAGRSGMLALGGDAVSDTAGALITALGRAQGERSPSSGLWAQGYGSVGDRRADDISSRYGYDTSGMMAGLDRQVADSLRLGISLGYSSTKAYMKELPDKATISSYQGALYGIYRNDPWYVSSVAAYGYNRYDTTRGISFGQIARRANVAYGGHTLGGYAEAGYRIVAAPVDVIPMVSLTGTSLMRNSFQERDAGAMNLDADAGRTSSLVGSLGVRLRKDYAVSSGNVTPEFRMRLDHEFSKNDHVLEASFSGYPASAFSVRADRPERNSFAPGFTLTWRTKGNMDFHLTYDGSFSEDSTQHGGTLGLRYTW